MPTLTGPYTELKVDTLQPYRASLHNHTFRGRPTAAPTVALGIYRLSGIPIVAITDHDRRMPDVASPPKQEDGQVPWLLADFEHSYDDAVLFRGFEASFPKDHVNIIGCVPEAIQLRPDDSGYIQTAHDLGGFTILNHPAKWNNQPEHVLGDDNLIRCRGIEVYNGNHSRNGIRGDATPLWDHWLSAGHRPWALANSDCHHYDFTLPSRPTNGYNVLWLASLSEQAVLDAVFQGRFYATNGLEIERISVENDTIAIEAGAAERFRFIGAKGRILREATGQMASYTPRGDEQYVRIEAHADQPAYSGAAVTRCAWTQPTWVTA